MKKRILSCFLALAMALSLLPMSVLAAGDGDDSRVVNGSYSGSTWSEGGTGSIIDEETGITLSKTATPNPDDPNKYTITLKVETSTETTVTDPSAAAVVLVMDLSNSMEACAECGGTSTDFWGNYIHTRNCSHSDSYVTAQQTRLYAAKQAAKDFLKTYAGDSATANRQLAIVAFGTTSKTVFSWANVAGGAGENSYDAAIRTIDNLEPGFENGTYNTIFGSRKYEDTGGTNLEAGIQLAANLVGMGGVSAISSKNVITLTDGVPTYHMVSSADRNATDALCKGGYDVDGEGSSGSSDNNQNAKNAANNVKNKSATLYTVCYGVANEKCYADGPTVGDFLSGSIASPKCAHNANNTDELNKAFEAISESITSGIDGKGLTVTDPMGDYITLDAVPAGATESDNGFTWTLGAPTNTWKDDDVTYYTYELTYNIIVNADAQDFDEDVYHPANKPTYITIPGEDGAEPTRIDFPVPGVKGTTSRYTVTWVNWDDTTLEVDENVTYGTMPSYDGETPTKPADAQFTYTFAGWTPDVSEVTGDITYKATYTSNTNTYTVTWVNWDDTTLEVDENVAYGTMPSYDGETPTKPADAQFSYTFAGWTPDVSEVTGDITYKATYTSNTNTYTVTWVNWDDTTLEVDENVAYGTMPSYDGETPTKPADAQFTYTFTGWTPDVSEVTGDITYTATYTSNINTYTLTYNPNGGTGGPGEQGDIAYGTNVTLDTKTPPTHDNADLNGESTPVVFIGWSLTQSNEIYEAGEQYPAIATEVGITNNTTVYAVWGYDTNEDNIPDAKQVFISPADITVYMGGQGYSSVVGEDGNPIGGSTTENGFPEPGFTVTLPYAIQDQSVTNLVLQYEQEDTTLTWSFEKYGEGDHNIYRIVPGAGTGSRDIRMMFTNPSSGDTFPSDSFVVDKNLNQNLTMEVYGEGIAADDVQIVSNNVPYSVGTQTAILTVRATTDAAQFGTLVSNTATAPVNEPAVTAEDGTTYTINDSEVQVSDTSGIALLFDDIIENNEIEGTSNTDLLEERAEQELENSSVLTGDGERQYEFKYLDLVDTNNGNAWVAASQDVTISWPLPEGTNKDTKFEVLHFEGLHREMGTNSIPDNINNCTVSSVENLEVTDTHVTFKVGEAGFSPFVLVWEDNAAPGLSVDKSIDTVNGREYTGGRVSVGDTIGYSIVVKNTGNTTLSDITVSDTLWTAGQTITVGDSTDSVNDDGNYVISTLNAGDSVSITYTYKVVRSDGGKTLSNTATAKDENGTTGKDTEEVVVKRPSGGGDVEPPVLDTENHYGYIVGYDDGTVRPNGKITRAEVATIFFRLLTDESRDAYWCQTNDFSDVSASDWYNNAISTLTNAGILDGYEDGTFRPNGNITRAEFATIAVRFFDLTYEGEDLFPDISDHWARDYINQAAAAGFVNGYEDGTFRPNNAITRAEAVTLVNRTLERKPHKAHLLADMIQWPDNMDQTTWYYADIQEATNSHEYYMTTSEQGEEYEIWTEILPVRDWPALEKEWSDANSSTGADVTN